MSSTDNRYYIRPDDLNDIIMFVALLNQPVMKAKIIDQARETRLGAVDPGEIVSTHIQEVLSTDPLVMYEAGYSFAELYALAKDIKGIPDNVLPASDFAEHMRFMYWEHFREKTIKSLRR